MFYAVALALAVVGDNHPYTVKAAWTYVGLRVGHSLYQVFVNRVLVSCVFFFVFSFLGGGDQREDSSGLTFSCDRHAFKSSLAVRLSLLGCGVVLRRLCSRKLLESAKKGGDRGGLVV